MKRLALFLLALPIAAHAADFEIAAGVARYQPRGNGMWYQDGFPHSISLNAPAVQIGLTGNLLPHLDWHADYVWLGQVRSDAIATSDANYGGPQQPCKGSCEWKNRLTGHGYVQGFKLSLEPYTHWNGWRFGVEAGAFVYKPYWQVDVIWRAAPDYNDSRWFTIKNTAAVQVAPMAGFSIGRDNVDVSYQFFLTKSLGKDQYSLYKTTHVLQLRYRF